MKSPVSENFASLVEAEVRAEGRTVTVVGTVFGRNTPRGWRSTSIALEAIPFGPLLILQNQDRPGLIGEIGGVLGEAGINIARMNFGRKRRLGDAITVFNLDAAPGKEVLAKIGTIRGIRTVRSVNLPPAPVEE